MMRDLREPTRVGDAAGKQARQAEIRTLDDVPARYRNYPGFDALTDDPAHRGDPCPKVIREAMAAAEADLSGAVKGPVTRPGDSPYIDFFDGEGYPFDVKTPLSPKAGDKWEFDAWRNAQTVLSQLDKDHPNKLTGETQPVAVLLDTTYMASDDRKALWRELMKQSKENRSVLKRIFEVNVRLDDAPVRTTPNRKLPAAVLSAVLSRNNGR